MILVLFSLRGLHLSKDDRACLIRLGFPLPTAEALSSRVAPLPKLLFDPDGPAKGSSMLGCNSLKHQGPGHGEAPLAKVPRLVPNLGRQVPACGAMCRFGLASGWDVVPIDQASCRFSPRTPLVILDLKDPLCVDLLLRFDRGAPADWFHLGLPCGTCSRARERPLPGNQGARPLRGPDDLFGFADLKPPVAASNAVYKACVRILFRAYETGALITIQNPVRSWLWPLLAVLVKSQGSKAFSDWFFSLQDYDFDACVFGSRRAKATRVKGSPGVFDGLQISCDNSHPHLSWKPVRVSGRWVYPTKEEAKYTPELCHFLCVQAALNSSTLGSRLA